MLEISANWIDLGSIGSIVTIKGCLFLCCFQWYFWKFSTTVIKDLYTNNVNGPIKKKFTRIAFRYLWQNVFHEDVSIRDDISGWFERVPFFRGKFCEKFHIVMLRKIVVQKIATFVSNIPRKMTHLHGYLNNN